MSAASPRVSVTSSGSRARGSSAVDRNRQTSVAGPAVVPSTVRFNDGMLSPIGWVALMALSAGAIVWGAELFAEHLAAASARLGVSAFALALLLAGAEPEEVATVVTASARGVDGVAFGDVIGANAAIAVVAIGPAAIPRCPSVSRVRRYGLGGLVAAILAGTFSWDGNVTRIGGTILVAGYAAFVERIWDPGTPTTRPR